MSDVQAIGGGIECNGDGLRLVVEPQPDGFVMLTVSLPHVAASWRLPAWAVEHLEQQCARARAEAAALMKESDR